MKHKGRNVIWSVGMDKCLIEALAVQAKNGNKVDKCFNDKAYTAACVAVNTRFNLNLTSQKAINRLKTIKKSDELWRRYIAVNPDAKAFRGKQIEMYEELRTVCGDYQTPGSSEEHSDTDGTESYAGASEYMHEESQDLPPPRDPLRRPSKRSRNSDPCQEAMLVVASSIRRLADAVVQSKTLINTEELLKAVMEIDELEEAKQMYAFEYLNGDPVKARAFMAYNNRMRKMFLFRQFWWWK
ncbi:unnamed protein product [Arabidopsis thaliana]|uniref:Myb/SANT-like domain-containing protein n=1 Tax=Arabidopsis thaliana TaxID=3702 RepID=A0A5S9XP83_ARATH|nr:unnamed protein product [Arabidopsis thaliana]